MNMNGWGFLTAVIGIFVVEHIVCHGMDCWVAKNGGEVPGRGLIVNFHETNSSDDEDILVPEQA